MALIALIVDCEPDAVLTHEMFQVGGATPRQCYVLRKLLCAGDDSRRERGRQAHALLLVELRVLKRGEPLDPVQ